MEEEFGVSRCKLLYKQQGPTVSCDKPQWKRILKLKKIFFVMGDISPIL